MGNLSASQLIKICHKNFWGMSILVNFPANFHKFQISLEHSIFIVQKRLIYEKSSISNEKYDAIKISNLLKF